MSASLLLLAVVFATLGRTQATFTGKRTLLISRGAGDLILLVLPLVAYYVAPDLGQSWRNMLYHIGFALSVVLMVARVEKWEKIWPLAVLWPVLPLIYTNDQVGLWLAMIAAEFLLLMVFHALQPFSDYHKFGFLRLLVIFQFFVFEHLFLQARPVWAGEILTSGLVLLYLAGLWRIFQNFKRQQVTNWLFLIAYIQYGIMVFDKIADGMLDLQSLSNLGGF
jgi:hypothetical protein